MKRKIHVFLGAPPPPGSELGGKGQEGACPPEGWRHLELTWRDGRLRPAAGVPANEGGASGIWSEPSNQGSGSKRGPIEPGADWTTDSAAGRCGTTEENSEGDEEGRCSGSAREYLDRCFPSEPEPEPEPAPSTGTRFLSTWTLSQALILRSVQSASSPGKTPPTTPLPSSPELFSHASPAPRAEHCGVVIEAVADGLLCSQETSAATPGSKKLHPSMRPAPTRTIRLSRCGEVGGRLSVLVAVVHPCHLKEVQVKSGPSAGRCVPLASIVVTDQSGPEMKVVLWRRAAFWVLTVNPGDILLITETALLLKVTRCNWTKRSGQVSGRPQGARSCDLRSEDWVGSSGLQVSEDKWRGETILQSSFCSKLLNLGHASSSPPGNQHVSARSVCVLCDYVRVRRPLLASLPGHPRQDLSRLAYATLRSLRANTVVHALLRVTHSHGSSEWRRSAESWSHSAVLSVEQPGGQQGALLLWGAALDWLPRFSKHRDAVWDFRVLLVREGLTSDLLELHSTPWSSASALDPTERRAQDFLWAWRHQSNRGIPLELDVDTLLSQQYSGEVELRVQVFTFQFQEAPPSQNPTQPVLDGGSPLDSVLAALAGDVTYTGCGRCCAELDVDENGIYGACYACLPHTAVRRFYRPAVMMMGGQGGGRLEVRVPPDVLQKILQAAPDRLQRSSAPGSQVRLVQVAAERIRSLLTPPRKTAAVRSHFLCDHNGVPISQDFTLLDLQVPSQ